MNNDLAGVNKIVIKLGTSTVLNPDLSIDLRVLKHLAEDIKTLRSRGIDSIIVTSGARGLGNKKGIKDARTSAGVGQYELMHAYSEIFAAREIIVEQILLESAHFRLSAINNFSRAVADAWSEGVLPIINENDPMATEKTTFGDNDKLARMAAEAIDAQMVVFFSTQNSAMNKARGKGGAKSKINEIKKLQRQDILVRLVDGKESHALKNIFDRDATSGQSNIDKLKEIARKSDSAADRKKIKE
jgi:glutamate 5-kinase